MASRRIPSKILQAFLSGRLCQCRGKPGRAMLADAAVPTCPGTFQGIATEHALTCSRPTKPLMRACYESVACRRRYSPQSTWIFEGHFLFTKHPSLFRMIPPGACVCSSPRWRRLQGSWFNLSFRVGMVASRSKASTDGVARELWNKLQWHFNCIQPPASVIRIRSFCRTCREVISALPTGHSGSTTSRREQEPATESTESGIGCFSR